MKKKLRILTILIIVIITAIILIWVFWPKAKTLSEVKVINQIEDYGYTLDDNETKLYDKYFNELVNILNKKEVDEEAYAKEIVKLFIADFYNLDNKLTKNDIGGTQYILASAKDNMILKAKDTIYKYVESNIDNNRDQELPVVSDIEIKSIKQAKFKYGTTTDSKAYQVSAQWTYKADLGYQDEATFTLVHEDKKLSIAEIN